MSSPLFVSEKVQQKRTWRLYIKRTDNRNDSLSNLHVQVIDKEKIILEFQTDNNTKPDIKPLMEIT